MPYTDFSGLLSSIAAAVWGTPLVILLVGGGLGLMFFSRMMPLRGFFHAVQLLSGRVIHINEPEAEGQISHFKALTNALSGTIGTGNIAGVALAIVQGGPGAVFWMWLAAVVGMITKFFECTLSVMYRGRDYQGQVQGGPMYVITNALPRYFRPAAWFFAFCALIGTMPLFNVNQFSSYLEYQHDVPRHWSGLFLALILFYILRGGLQRLSAFTASLVPLMCVLYLLMALVVISGGAGDIADIFPVILQHAWIGEAAFGGAMGTGVIAVMRTGIRRAAFSNEAGLGTAAMAHSNARTSEPVSEGLVAMLGPFIDTILVCSVTAVVILSQIPPEGLQGRDGILLAVNAFESALPGLGGFLLGICLILFSVTTVIGMANCNQKCWDFLFRGRYNMGTLAFQFWFCGALFLAAISPMLNVVNLVDICYGLMTIPNMISVFILAPAVMKATRNYFLSYGVVKIREAGERPLSGAGEHGRGI